MKSKKLKIMKTRPDISDQEIDAMMDFDKVVNKYQSIKTKAKFVWVMGAGGVALVAVVSLLVVRPAQQEPQPKPEQPIILPEKKQEPTVVVEEKKSEPVKPEIKQKPVQATESKEVYTEAEPVNGYPDLYSYFQKELAYPAEALKDSIEGIVSVSFVINKNGKPEQVKILNSLGDAFDNEAIRVVNGMPAWKSASLNGKPVPARISIPLTFQVNRSSKLQ